MSLTNCVAALASTAMAGLAFAASSTPDDAVTARLAELERGMQSLRTENSQLKNKLDEVMTQNGEKWLTEQRASEIRSVVQDVLSDADTRSSLQAAQTTGGYDKGFFLASPDGNFKLKFAGQIQSRWAGSFYSQRDVNNLNAWKGQGVTRGGASVATAGTKYDKTADGFELRRLKLDFSGHVIDPSWQYRVVLAYAQTSNQVAAGASGGGNNSSMGLEDTYIRKDLGDGFAVQMGQFKSPFLKEELTSSKYQLSAERSVVNQMFSTKFTQGVMGEWRGDNLLVQGSYNDGGNNANTSEMVGSTNNSLNNNGLGFVSWAVTGRMAYLVFGNWKQFDDMSSFRGEDSGLMLGSSMNWQMGGQDMGGNTPAVSYPLDGNSDGKFLTWSFDASWDLGGANLYSAFVMNTAYSLPNGDASINSYAVFVQGGYFLTDELETFARWEWMQTANEGFNDVSMPATTAGKLVPSANVFNAGKVQIATIGANYYFNGSKNVKLTTDLGWTFAGALWFNNGIYGQNIAGADYRIEPEGGGNEVVVRVQLQLLF